MQATIPSLQHIDRRWIYLVLSIALILALLAGKRETPVVMPSVQSFYDAVEAAPARPGDGKLILVASTFSASTLPENGNQLRAVLRHLMLRKQRFAIFAIAEPQGAQLGPAIAEDLAKQYGYTYGEDWIAFGYQLGTIALYKTLPRDIPGFIKTDSVLKKPLSTFPIMRGINTVSDDVAMHIEVTASDSVFSWIALVQPATKPRLKIGYACTGIMAAEAYPYLDSGQLVGMAPGLKGAADYERLVDELDDQLHNKPASAIPYDASKNPLPGLRRTARQLMFTQGVAHLVVIIFIILGNIGMLLTRIRPRATKEESANG